MKKVNMFLSDATEKRYLSATSINEFLSCPLKFYFKYIERTKTEAEINDYMDESVFGQIVHKVLELVYSEYKGTEITSDILKQLATKSGDINIKLEKHITATINKIYKKLPSNNGENLTPLTGEADILGKLIKEIVIYMFQCEMEFNKRPFKFEDAEMEIKTSLKFDDNREFNITGVIDRVDEIGNNTKRLIDYKTGADEVSISGIEDITTNEPNRPHSKAILQLFLYGEMYKKHQHFTGNIMPIIYNIKRIAKEGLKPITIGKQELDGNLYANIHDEVIQNFNSRISALFDKEKPFEPTPSSKACKFCDFKDICEQSVE
jgi:CRISPR/Cas system-associated exonuclease Cas4 (RecB family)